MAEYTPRVNSVNRSIVSKIRRFSWKSSRSPLNLTSDEDKSLSNGSHEFPDSSVRQTTSSEHLDHPRSRASCEWMQENGFLPNLKEESAKLEPNLLKSESGGCEKWTDDDLDEMMDLEKSLVEALGMVEENTNQNESEQRDRSVPLNQISVSEKNGFAEGELDSLVWKRDKITASAGDEHIEIETETAVAPKSRIGSVSCPLLPPLDQPVPSNWVTMEESFIFVTVVYQTHLGIDMLAAPHAHLSDGFVYVVFAREGLSKPALLSLLMTFGDGGHVDSPHVEIVKALAFRLEPVTNEGNMMVDGEKVECGPIQGQILPHLSRIMAMQ